MPVASGLLVVCQSVSQHQRHEHPQSSAPTMSPSPSPRSSLGRSVALARAANARQHGITAKRFRSAGGVLLLLVLLTCAWISHFSWRQHVDGSGTSLPRAARVLSNKRGGDSDRDHGRPKTGVEASRPRYVVCTRVRYVSSGCVEAAAFYFRRARLTRARLSIAATRPRTCASGSSTTS